MNDGQFGWTILGRRCLVISNMKYFVEFRPPYIYIGLRSKKDNKLLHHPDVKVWFLHGAKLMSALTTSYNDDVDGYIFLIIRY